MNLMIYLSLNLNKNWWWWSIFVNKFIVI